MIRISIDGSDQQQQPEPYASSFPRKKMPHQKFVMRKQQLKNIVFKKNNELYVIRHRTYKKNWTEN